MKQILKQSLTEAPIIKKGTYSYIIHPLTDGIPELQPSMLTEVVQRIKPHIVSALPIDKLVTIEAMGIPLTTAVSLELCIPFTIIRKRSYGLPYEISLKQITGYSKETLYINGIEPQQNVIIVDDVLSTGGTLRAVIKGLQSIEVNIKKIITIINKGTVANNISKQTGIPVVSLFQVEIKDNKIVFKQESI